MIFSEVDDDEFNFADNVLCGPYLERRRKFGPAVLGVSGLLGNEKYAHDRLRDVALIHKIKHNSR